MKSDPCGCVKVTCRRPSRPPRFRGAYLLAVGVLWGAFSARSEATICIVPDNGGTAQLPPNCPTGYLSPDDVHMIIDGLPPGTTILVDASHSKFGLFNSGPGGTLGGEFEQFQSFIQLNMTGTGALNGFNRSIFMQAQCETHVGPRMPGAPVQSFPTDFFMMQGQLFPGDPDFDLLRLTAGSAFGMPSPGHTTLTQQGTGWAVDSFFDITYRLDFVGAPGGPLGGMSGSTTGTIRMQAGETSCAVVLPGVDKWHTIDPTNVMFGSPGVPPIPADFFYPGSAPFSGVIVLQGQPLDPQDSDVDTIVQRLAPAQVPNPGDGATIPIELVELSLRSLEPIDVGGRFFDVFVDLSPTMPSMGSMTIIKQHPNGGVFNSQINVKPRFQFTEVPGGGPTLTLPGAAGLNLTSPQHQWTCDPPGGSVPGAGPNFFPDPIPLTETHPNGAVHTVVPGNKTFALEFSLDWGSDSELNDPQQDGDEGFDAGDVYLWQGPPVTPPIVPCGADGFKDDATLFSSGDPIANAGSCNPFFLCQPGVCNLGCYDEVFDLDGHDQLDVNLQTVIPASGLAAPIPRGSLNATCVYEPRYLLISYDDDQAPGWTTNNMPVNVSSPIGNIYGTTSGKDEVLSVILAAGVPPVAVSSVTPYADEVTVHSDLGPNPDAGNPDDDDVDSLDIVPSTTACPWWYFSADREARTLAMLDAGSIYLRIALGASVKVVDDVIHLGINENTDIDDFEFVWLPDASGSNFFLGVIFTVDDNDPCTLGENESGGLIPGMIYGSFMTGSSFPLLTAPLADDVDALTNWCQAVLPPQKCEALPDGSGCTAYNCPAPPPEHCKPKCIKVTQSGQQLVTSCECLGTSECHAEFGGPAPSLPICVDACPPGFTCTQTFTDIIESDGTPSRVYCCDCVQDMGNCQPNVTGTDCTTNCPAGQQCVPREILADNLGNFIAVTCCDCVATECHVDYNPLSSQIGCVNSCPTPGLQCELLGKGNLDGTITYSCECLDPLNPGQCQFLTECVAPPCGGGMCIKHCTGPCPVPEVCRPSTIVESPFGSGNFTADCVCDDPDSGECRPVVNSNNQVECIKTCPDGTNCPPPTFTVDAANNATYTCPPCPANDCGPLLPDRQDCAPFVCPGPIPPTDECKPRCIEFNPATLQYEVIDCECRPQQTCHVEFPVGAPEPYCVQPCPTAGDICTKTETTDPLTGLKTICCDCEPHVPTLCPLTLPAAVDPCAPLQGQDCDSLDPMNEACLPRVVSSGVGGGVVVERCDCFGGEKCGPVQINGNTVSCPGFCPPPNVQGDCLVHVDGMSLGSSIITLPHPAIQPGMDITCRCEPVPPLGACCYDADGDGVQETCTVTTAANCMALGGSFHGGGTNCGTVGACCYDANADGVSESCAVMDSTCCTDLGGTFNGTGSNCLGDNNGNGIDDLCDCPPDALETIIFRSGNGIVGGVDSAIRCLPGAGGVPLSPVVFNFGWFAHACVYPQAWIVTPHPAWLPGSGGLLPADPLARWISSNPTKAPNSSLYCHKFRVCCPQAGNASNQLTIRYAVDDWLSDNPAGPNNIGFYINQTPLAGSNVGGFGVQSTFTAFNVPLVPGVNTLHVYQRDVGVVVSGTIYSAELTVDCPEEACCFPNGSCANLDACCCRTIGGIPKGAGSACLGDLNFNGRDDICEELACCTGNGQCIDMAPGVTSCPVGATPHVGPCQANQPCCLPGVGCVSMEPRCCLDEGGTVGCTPFSCPVICDDDTDCDDTAVCTLDQCGPGGNCTHTAILYADVNFDDFVNVDDALCELETFAGNPGSAACLGASMDAKDIEPCPGMGDPDNMGNGFINVDDVLRVLDVFAGTTFPCSVCNGGPAPASDGGSAGREGAELNDSATSHGPIGAALPKTAGPAEASIVLSPSRRVVSPGDVVPVNVFVNGALTNLRAYQVVVRTRSLSKGASADAGWTASAVTIDATRADYVFHGLETLSSTNASRAGLMSLLPAGGMVVDGQGYLGTVMLRIPNDARGLFRLSVDLSADGSHLRNAFSEPITVDAVDAVVLVAKAGRSTSEGAQTK